MNKHACLKKALSFILSFYLLASTITVFASGSASETPSPTTSSVYETPKPTVEPTATPALEQTDEFADENLPLAEAVPFNEYMYLADLLLSNLPGSSAVGANGFTPQSMMLYFWMDPNNASGARILVRQLEADKDFMAGVKAWEIITFDPKNLLDNMLDKKGYYQSIIFNVLSKNLLGLSSDAKQTARAVKNTVEVSKAMSEVFMESAKGDWDLIMNMPMNELEDDTLEILYEYTTERLESASLINMGIKSFSDFFGNAVTVQSCISRAASYAAMNSAGEDTRAVLWALMQVVESDDAIALYDALSDVFLAVGESADAILAGIKNGALELADFSYARFISKLWDGFFTAAGIKPLLIGQLVGSSLSNFFFSTDAIIEQFYVLQSVVAFEDALAEAVRRLSLEYMDNRTEANARAFLAAADMMFSVYDLGIDYAEEFAKTAFERKVIKKVRSLMGTDMSTAEFINAMESMRFEINKVQKNLFQLDYHKDFLELDYPEEYENRYGSQAGITPISERSVGSMIPAYIETADGEQQLNGYFACVINGSEATITGYIGICTGKLIIPDRVDGSIAVTIIADNAFMSRPDVVSVVVPNTVIAIGKHAFFGCENLAEITLGARVRSIGREFIGGTAVTTITIPKNVTFMEAALSAANALETVVFEKGIPSVPAHALAGALTMTSVTIPDSVTIIGEGAFAGCYSLTEITLPIDLEFIGDYAFMECPGLTVVTIPDTVESIGNNAFFGCNNLIIKCAEGSAANDYATTNGIPTQR